VPEFRPYTLDEVRQHRKRGDAWTAIHGKVYNMTAYFPFHPGGMSPPSFCAASLLQLLTIALSIGDKYLMSIAGKDGTKDFMETHSWVNAEKMLEKCMVGVLRPDTGPKEDSDSDSDSD
jgi:cytochrome b involved in lipid metabolism